MPLVYLYLPFISLLIRLIFELYTFSFGAAAWWYFRHTRLFIITAASHWSLPFWIFPSMSLFLYVKIREARDSAHICFWWHKSRMHIAPRHAAATLDLIDIGYFRRWFYDCCCWWWLPARLPGLYITASLRCPILKMIERLLASLCVIATIFPATPAFCHSLLPVIYPFWRRASRFYAFSPLYIYAAVVI